IVSHVTSIDPSAGMIGVLKEKTAEQGITNVHCVLKRWEEVDITRDLYPPYDVVLASLSLGMYDIKESIQKMLDATSRFVYLFWFAGEPSWDVHARALIPLLHGTDFQPMPRCDVLFNVLYQMGIYPHVEVYPYQHLNVFASKEEAVTYFAHRFGASTKRQREILGEYLAGILQNERGFLVLRSPATCLKMWWERSIIERQALPSRRCDTKRGAYAGSGAGHFQ
ncbi:MAG: class I SAM-dependent methyltransferase, partial [bacterium]